VSLIPAELRGPDVREIRPEQTTSTNMMVLWDRATMTPGTPDITIPGTPPQTIPGTPEQFIPGTPPQTIPGTPPVVIPPTGSIREIIKPGSPAEFTIPWPFDEPEQRDVEETWQLVDSAGQPVRNVERNVPAGKFEGLVIIGGHPSNMINVALGEKIWLNTLPRQQRTIFVKGRMFSCNPGTVIIGQGQPSFWTSMDFLEEIMIGVAGFVGADGVNSVRVRWVAKRQRLLLSARWEINPKSESYLTTTERRIAHFDSNIFINGKQLITSSRDGAKSISGNTGLHTGGFYTAGQDGLKVLPGAPIRVRVTNREYLSHLLISVVPDIFNLAILEGVRNTITASANYPTFPESQKSRKHISYRWLPNEWLVVAGTPGQTIPGTPDITIPGTPPRTIPGTPPRTIPGTPPRTIPGNPPQRIPGIEAVTVAYVSMGRVAADHRVLWGGDDGFAAIGATRLRMRGGRLFGVPVFAVAQSARGAIAVLRWLTGMNTWFGGAWESALSGQWVRRAAWQDLARAVRYAAGLGTTRAVAVRETGERVSTADFGAEEFLATDWELLDGTQEPSEIDVTDWVFSGSGGVPFAVVRSTSGGGGDPPVSINPPGGGGGGGGGGTLPGVPSTGEGFVYMRDGQARLVGAELLSTGATWRPS
jgi:hypothetical protein